MSQDLTGRAAVVTGAGTGLGSAIARELATAGADLLLHYREHAGPAERLAGELRALGRRAELAAADFAADPAGAAGVVEAAVERLGRVDILVNNAGDTSAMAPLETMPRELFDSVLRVNVEAPFMATQAAARHMIAQGRGGRIINIGSVHGIQSAPEHTAYEVSKGALHALTFSTAVSLGRHGITVNCVAPGAIVVERYADADWDEEWFISRTPVGRNGRPEDIATMVRHLASEEAGFITGQIIVIDGGMTRRMPLVR